MNLFSKYLQEREGFETYVHMGVGFMTFRVQGEGGAEFYIRDMYVLADYRRKRVAWEMADQVFEIAKKRGCKWVVGTVYPAASGGTESVGAMLAYGFKLHACDFEKIIFRKELG